MTDRAIDAFALGFGTDGDSGPCGPDGTDAPLTPDGEHVPCGANGPFVPSVAGKVKPGDIELGTMVDVDCGDRSSRDESFAGECDDGHEFEPGDGDTGDPGDTAQVGTVGDGGDGGDGSKAESALPNRRRTGTELLSSTRCTRGLKSGKLGMTRI